MSEYDHPLGGYRGLFNFLMIVSFAAEIYQLCTMEITYRMKPVDMPWWLGMMEVGYSTFTLLLFPARQWIKACIFLSLSLIHYAVADALTNIQYAYVDSGICLALLTICMIQEIQRIIAWNRYNGGEHVPMTIYGNAKMRQQHK